jgi:ERCC4-type nuclease
VDGKIFQILMTGGLKIIVLYTEQQRRQLNILDLYKYTDKEKELLLESMVILIDTREKKIDHITNSFDKAGIKYKVKALKYGDYSFILTKNLDLGIPRDISFEGKVVIERKASLEELSTNLTKGRDRIEKEFALSPYEKVLLVENANYSDIVDGNYRGDYNKKSFLASIHTFWFKYHIPIFFMPDNKYSPLFIKKYFEYYLKNYMR